MREQEEEQKRTRAQLSERELAAKAAELEQSTRNYSDIDMIYEKNAKYKQTAKRDDDDLMTDDQMESLFSSLMEEEEQR